MNYVYLSITLEKRKLTFEEHLDAMLTKGYSSIEEIDENLPRDKEVVVRLNTTDMAILVFIIGAVLSLIIAVLYNKFFAKPFHKKKLPNNNDTSYVNMTFSKETSAEDFDYPYEDIGDTLKGNNNVG